MFHSTSPRIRPHVLRQHLGPQPVILKVFILLVLTKLSRHQRQHRDHILRRRHGGLLLETAIPPAQLVALERAEVLTGAQQTVAFPLRGRGDVLGDARERVLEARRERHLGRHGVDQRQEGVRVGPFVPRRHHGLTAARADLALVGAAQRVPARADGLQEDGGAGFGRDER